MKCACSISCLVLLTLGACLGQDERQEPGQELAEGTVFWKALLEVLEDDLPGSFSGHPRSKKTVDPSNLFSVAKELQGFGKERAGFRFRFGRQGEENEAADFLQLAEEKRGDSTLGSLAEELNGYNRKKGGFNFRFGRR
ncbi:orexigenic neuropeptide QRFP [Ambystoma mexicanum]|uniref:orexigenic neuropeptide QRFP n=1 Tax=Ambystoma mexicanum TaxID=8296 RepID=UPI0037E9424D